MCLYVYIIYVYNIYNTYDMMYIIGMLLKDSGYWGRELFSPAINPVSYSRDCPGKIYQLLSMAWILLQQPLSAWTYSLPHKMGLILGPIN